MKALADTHVLVFAPDRPIDTALDTLLKAENRDIILVSAATLADLWYASQKTSSPAIASGVHETRSIPPSSTRRRNGGGLIPLTCNEIARLVNQLIIEPTSA